MKRQRKLKEKDILNCFIELGRWLSEHRIHAEVIVHGGAALVLQTHCRARVHDMDLVWKQITSNHSSVIELAALRWEKKMDSAAFSSALDFSFARKVGQAKYLLNFHANNRKTIPYGEVLDNEGFGVTLKLATLKDIRAGMQSAADEAGTLFAPHSMYDEIYLGWLFARERYLGIASTKLRSNFYWKINLGPARPVSSSAQPSETEEATRLIV